MACRELWISLLIIGVLIVMICIIYAICRFYKQQSQDTGSDANGPVLILQNWNPAAGFFYAMYNVLNALWSVEKSKNFKLIVLYNSGLYKEDRQQFIKENPYYDAENWFNYYFEPINQTNKPQQFWQKFIEKHPMMENTTEKDMEKISDSHKVQKFDRTTLNSVNPGVDREIEYNRLWNKHIKIRPHIADMVEQFAKKHNFQNKFIIGLHARLTDKFPSKSGNEDGPRRVGKKWIKDLVWKKVKSSGKDIKDILVYVASDEHPFINYMKQSGLPVVAFDNAVRADIDSSDMDMDTSDCEQGLMHSEVCKKYNAMIDASIHRGMPDISNYKKGLDALIEVLLLAKSNIFLQSKGNLSNFGRYLLLSKNAEIVDMVSLFESEQST